MPLFIGTQVSHLRQPQVRHPACQLLPAKIIIILKLLYPDNCFIIIINLSKRPPPGDGSFCVLQ